MDNKQIRVGTIVTAKRATAVCDAGERGGCYEVYELEGRPGYSFIFEKGRYDGFSPDDVISMLDVTDHVVPSIADYQFQNVSQLDQDFRSGRFTSAFVPA